MSNLVENKKNLPTLPRKEELVIVTDENGIHIVLEKETAEWMAKGILNNEENNKYFFYQPLRVRFVDKRKNE